MEGSICCGLPPGTAMNSAPNSSFDRSTPKSLTPCNDGSWYRAIRTAICFGGWVFFLVLTLVILSHEVVIAAAEHSDSGALVDIGGGRKIYLQCSGVGSPTVVLVSGTRGAHDDWTDLMDLKNPTGGTKPGRSAVFPELSKVTRVCVYDRPGTTRNDNTLTNSTPVRQPTTAQQGVADLHALLIAAKEPAPYILVGHSWGGLIARLFANTYPDEAAGLVLVDPASEFLKKSLTPTSGRRTSRLRKSSWNLTDWKRQTTRVRLNCFTTRLKYARCPLLCLPQTSDLILAPEGLRHGPRGEPLRIVSQKF